MKILFMGTPEFSAHFLKDLCAHHLDVVAVVTQPDRPRGRGLKLYPPPVKEAAMALGLPVLQPENLRDPDFLQQLKEFQADLSIVVAFSLLPTVVLGTTRLGAVNLHGSLLPRYRGAAPVQWAIAHGDTETGVTVFLLDEKMDHGPLLVQKTLAVPPEATAAEILDQMIPLGCEAIREALAQLEQGSCKPLPQNHTQACPARKLRKEDALIPWHDSAQVIHNRVRAFQPWPGALSFWQGKKIQLRQTAVLPADSSLPKLQPGEFQQSQGRVLVGTGSGILQIIQVQPEGKKMMAAEDWLRGLPVAQAYCFEMSTEV